MHGLQRTIRSLDDVMIQHAWSLKEDYNLPFSDGLGSRALRVTRHIGNAPRNPPVLLDLLPPEMC
jgi:hypothetical protein